MSDLGIRSPNHKPWPNTNITVSPSSVSQAVPAVQISTASLLPRSSTKGFTVHWRSLQWIGLKLAPKQWVSAWLSDSVGVQLKFNLSSATVRPIVAELILAARGPVLTTLIDDWFAFQVIRFPWWSHLDSVVMTKLTTEPPPVLTPATPAPIWGRLTGACTWIGAAGWPCAKEARITPLTTAPIAASLSVPARVSTAEARYSISSS